MSKWTTVILAVLLFAGLAVAIFVGAPEPPAPALPALFLEFARAEVKSLDVTAGTTEIHLEKDAKVQDRWRVLSGKALVRASSEKVEDLLNDLSRLAPKNLWRAGEVKAAERANWGLDKPAAAVRLGFEGREVRASFGKRTPEGMNAYAERDGNGDVWVVPGPVLESLEKLDLAGLRERKPVGLSSYDVRSFSVEREDGAVLEASKGSAGTWEVTRPYRGAADPQALEELLAKALHVEAVEFVADANPDLDRYGLLRPRTTITLRKNAVETPVVILLGAEAPGGRTYFTEKGEPSVYACGAELPGAVADLDPAKIRDRNALRLGWARLDSLEYRGGGEKSWKLLRMLERWDLEKPERVPAEGPAVEGLLDLLRKTEALRFLDAEDPAALGLDDPEKAPARLLLRGTDDAGTRDLLLGKRDAEGNAPARLLEKGDPGATGTLFLLPKDLLDRLEEGWLSFRGLEVWRLDLTEVRGLTRTMGGRTESFDFERSTWKGPSGGPEPDGAALTRALTHLLTLRCSGYEAKAKEDLGRWGLGDPPATASLTVRTRKSGKDAKDDGRTLVLGSEAEGGGHFARLSDGDTVFRLPDHTLNGTDVVPLFEILKAPWEKAAPEPPPGEEERPKEGEAPK